ncbi:unnamed protein product, partial [Symbiodinium sp. CCMP2456]
VADFVPQGRGEGRSNSRTRSLSSGRRPSKADGQTLGMRTVTPPLQNVDLNVGQFTGSRISGRRPSQPKLQGNGLTAHSFQSHQGLQGSHISTAGDGKQDRQRSSERTTFETLKARAAGADAAKAQQARSLSISGQCARRGQSPKADSRRRPSRAGVNVAQARIQAEPSLKSLQDTLSKLEEDKERSQGFATQCKRALDKLGVLGVLTMMSPASGRSQAACNSALDKAIRNAVGSPVHETGAQGPSDGLSVMGCGPTSPKGTQAGLSGNLGGSPTSRTPGSRKGRETDTEEMSAMGLTVQRMETAKTAEHAPEMEPQEPEELQEGEEELPVETGDEFDVDEEELLSDDHLKSIRKLMFILRLWSGSKAFKNGSGDDLEASKPLADAAEERETPVQQVFDVVARVKARSGAMLCSQRSFENLLETLQKVDKAAGAKIYKKIPLSRVREAFNEQIALQISLSSRYGLSAAEASKGMVFETFRTCMHRLFYRPLETEEEVKELLIQSKAAF